MNCKKFWYNFYSSSKSNVWFEMVREIGRRLVGNPQGSIRHFLQKQKLTKIWSKQHFTRAIVHFLHTDMEKNYIQIFWLSKLFKMCVIMQAMP